MPSEINVACGTAETDLGLPTGLTANLSDGTSLSVAVNWICTTDYNPNPDDPANAAFVFAAELAEAHPCEVEAMPQITVRFKVEPTPEEVLAEYAISKDGAIEDGDYLISNGELKLYSGTYYVDRTTESPVKIYVYSKLIANADVNGDVTVSYGGTVSLKNVTGDLNLSRSTATICTDTFTGKIYLSSSCNLTVENTVIADDTIAPRENCNVTLTGSKTVASTLNIWKNCQVTVRDGATVKDANLTAGTLNVNSATVETISQSGLNGDSTLNASGATLGTISLGDLHSFSSGAMALNIQGGSINRLEFENADATVQLDGVEIRGIDGLSYYAADIAEAYWPKNGDENRLPAAGTAASDIPKPPPSSRRLTKPTPSRFRRS